MCGRCYSVFMQRVPVKVGMIDPGDVERTSSFKFLLRLSHSVNMISATKSCIL